jgi:hypothetical protein
VVLTDTGFSKRPCNSAKESRAYSFIAFFDWIRESMIGSLDRNNVRELPSAVPGAYVDEGPGGL